MSPVISVVIPTHNRSHLLPRAVNSVLAQTFTDFELIIVDDASQDRTSEVVNSISDSRIRYLVHERNQGNAATRNTGVRAAKCMYVAFLDDDDEYLPEFLTTMLQYLEAAGQNVGFAWCGTRTVRDTARGEEDVSSGVWQPVYKNRNEAYLSFLNSRRIGTNCGLTIRRSCFDRVGLFEESIRKAVDTEFLIRLIREFDFIAVPEILVKLHDHEGDRVRNNSVYGAQAYRHIIEQHRDALVSNPHLYSSLHYKTAWQYYHAGDKEKGRIYIRKALRKTPTFWKGWLAFGMFELFGARAVSLHKLVSRTKG